MRLARPLGSIGLALSLLVSTPLAYSAQSGSSGSGRSSPSYSFSKPSSPPTSSFSKPSTSSPSFSKPAPSPPTSSFSKPSPSPSFSKPDTPKPAIAPPRTAVDTTIAKGQSRQAYQQFQAEQQRFRAPPAAAPTDTRMARETPAWRQYGNRWRSADSYYADRERAFQHQPSVRMYYDHPPAYVLSGRPSYGAYAAAFLGGMLLDRVTQPSYANWAYSHYNDPGFQAWHADMEREAVNNAELREKLAQLDGQVQQLKARNAPVTEALPEDVDASLVVAPQTAMLATASSHWLLWTILTVIALIFAFFAVCVVISQRRRTN